MGSESFSNRYIFYTFLQTKCVQNYVNTGGGLSSQPGICQLNQNILNQYIFLILWFWFAVLSVIGFLQLVFETFTVIPKFRVLLIKWKLSPFADENTIKRCLKDLEIGDWFLLYQISKNMDKHFFYEFIKTVSKTSRIEEMPLEDVEASADEGNPNNSEENSNIC